MFTCLANSACTAALPSPGARYQRRYTTNGTVLPREKLKLRDRPGEREEYLELDQCATRNTATRERCGEIVHAHPCGDVVELYGLYHFHQ
jgi:hypothetical protein